MPDLIRHLRNSTLMRFVLAGAINTLFGFLVYSAAILVGAAVWLALLTGICAGVAFNFLTTGGYVFRDLSPKRFPGFLLTYAFIYLLNLGLIALLSRWIANPIWAQAIVTLPMAWISYVLMARWVFKARR